MNPPMQPHILMVGNDPSLAYLIGRYAEHIGYCVISTQTIPDLSEVCNQKPAAILFPSVESLESAQFLITGLANCDIPILVCSAVADEVRAHELGADYCLVHPVTYKGFTEALAVRVHRS
jgi:DNA-binding response OmpR family regulator